MPKLDRNALVLAVLGMAVPLVGSPINHPDLTLAPKLHIKSFTAVSPACGKQVDLRVEIQNLTGTPFAGSKPFGGAPSPAVVVTDVSSKKSFMLPLPNVGANSTISVGLGSSTFSMACPSSTCWDAQLVLYGPGGASNLPEWDGKTGVVCVKADVSFYVGLPTWPLHRS